MPIQILKEEERHTYELDGSKIQYRRMSTLKRGQVVRRHTRRGKVDWDAVTREMLQYVITGWENVQSGGQSVPYSPELVTQLPDEVTNEILELSGAAMLQDGEDREKN